MKNLFRLGLLSMIIVACDSEKSTSGNLITENFASSHSEWVFSKDTITKDVNFKFEGFEVPAKISWVTAMDTSSCLRIGFLKLDRQEGDASIKVSNVSTGSVECGMTWDSDDTTKYETVIINGSITAKKGIKGYSYDGELVRINGMGEYKMVN